MQAKTGQNAVPNGRFKSKLASPFAASPKNVFTWFASAVVVLLAAVVRLAHLGQTPVGLYWDEMAMYVDVKSVLQSGQDMFGRPWFQILYPSYGDFKQPFYISSAIASAKLFGLSEWSLRLPSVLAGVGTVIVVGYLARWLFGKRAQLVAMLVMAVSPWAVMFSRTGFEGHEGQFLLACSVACIFASVDVRGKRARLWQMLLLILSGVMGAAATYAYFSVRFVWIAVAVGALVIAYLPKQNWRAFFQHHWQKMLTIGLCPLVIYAVLLIPMFRSPLYKDANTFRLGTDSVLNQDYVVQSNIYRELAGNSRFDRILFNSKVLMAQALLKNYAANTSWDFLFLTGDPNLRHGTTRFGLFVWPLLPFFVWGIFQLFLKRRLVLFWLIGWWLVALLPASVPLNVPHALRSLNALVPLVLIMAYGFGQVATAMFAKFSKYVSIGIIAVITLLFSFVTVQFFQDYFQFYPLRSAADWQDGYKQIAVAALAAKQPGDTLVVVPFDDRFYLWLMGYGPYTAADFHHWQSDRYQFLQFGQEKIVFQQLSDQMLKNASGTVWAIGKQAEITKELATLKKQPVSRQVITGANPADAFELVKF